ncbi:hypothetical protein Peur_059911 [Populus x canadensis]
MKRKVMSLSLLLVRVLLSHVSLVVAISSDSLTFYLCFKAILSVEKIITFHYSRPILCPTTLFFGLKCEPHCSCRSHVFLKTIEEEFWL